MNETQKIKEEIEAARIEVKKYLEKANDYIRDREAQLVDLQKEKEKEKEAVKSLTPDYSFLKFATGVGVGVALTSGLIAGAGIAALIFHAYRIF